MLARIAVALAIVSGLSAECVQVGLLGDVEIAVFSGHERLTGGIEADLLTMDGKFISKASSGRFEQVTYGDYRVKVVVRGFRTEWRDIRVAHPSQVVRVPVEVGVECEVRGAIFGIVKGMGQSDDAWVKVIPLIGTAGFEGRIDRQGRFSLEGLPFGDSVLLVVRGSTILHHRVISLTLENAALRGYAVDLAKEQ